MFPPTSKQHQSKAPVSVPQCAAAQQDLLIAQRVFLTGVGQRSYKAVQAVVGGFTAYLTLREMEVTQQGFEVVFRTTNERLRHVCI